jgi:hypothetical protein
MTNPEEDRLVRQAIATTARVAREGGIGEVILPHPETGQLVTVKIDQEAAQESICRFIHYSVGDLWKQVSDGQPLSPTDRMVLRTWTSATLADSEAAESERRAESKRRRSRFTLVNRDEQELEFPS